MVIINIKRLNKILSGMIDIRKIDYLFQDEFDTSEVIKLITNDKYQYREWDVRELYNCENKGLLIGFKMVDELYVLITKTSNNTFKIDNVDHKLNISHYQTNVNSDNLSDCINSWYNSFNESRWN